MKREDGENKAVDVNEHFQYLDVGLPEDILRKKSQGDFDGAVRLIDKRLAGHLPRALRSCLTAQREMILRMPADYPYTKAQALERILERIPDFSQEEFDGSVDGGDIRWIYANGETRFFGRFFESMCKSNPNFAQRAGVRLSGAESARRGTSSYERLERCRRLMQTRGGMANGIRIRASLRLRDDLFVPGMFLRAHLPIPAACEQQSEITVEGASPGGVLASEDAPQRTICWERALEKNETFWVEYSYVFRAVYRRTDQIRSDVCQPDFCTREVRPHIAFTPYIRELVRVLTHGTNDPLEKARRFYDYITLRMKYTFMPAYFCLENIADNCAKSMTGDCGVFALLFLTLCRCAGIPACWQSGLAAEPDFCGAHDWTRFYIAPYGWLYADASYGVAAAREGNEERRRFYFGNLDPYRMAANNAFQAPFTPRKRGWRADPYDNQVGELETNTRGLRYEEFERTKEVLSCQEVE